MDKGGGIGSMIKGMGSKIGKVKVVGSKMVDTAGSISNKVGEMGGKAKSIESTIKDKVNLSERKDITKEKLTEGIDKIKNFDDNIAEKQAKTRITSELLDGKSVVNKYGLFGPDTYKYLIYVILFLNICCITLLLFNETTFYKYQNSAHSYNIPVYLRLNKNVFYIYIFSLFLLILQLYTLKENYNIIVERRGTFQVYLEIFNVLCTIGLTYYIYTQIDFIHTECPEPNKRMCVANTRGPNEIQGCPNGSFQCADIEFKEYDCRKPNCDENIAENFHLVPPPPAPKPPQTCADFNPELCTDPDIPYNASGICIEESCTPEDCCKSESVNARTEKYFTELFNRLIKGDEDRISTLEGRINNLSPGSAIPGPPGPVGPAGPSGPPGTPGSDSRPSVPPSNQFENILCPNEPGGLCKDGVSRCNDQGMCEGFALISLQDKIDLKLKYKDLNSNSYKADNLMNNLETFLLNTLK